MKVHKVNNCLAALSQWTDALREIGELGLVAGDALPLTRLWNKLWEAYLEVQLQIANNVSVVSEVIFNRVIAEGAGLRFLVHAYDLKSVKFIRQLVETAEATGQDAQQLLVHYFYKDGSSLSATVI